MCVFYIADQAGTLLAPGPRDRGSREEFLTLPLPRDPVLENACFKEKEAFPGPPSTAPWRGLWTGQSLDCRAFPPCFNTFSHRCGSEHEWSEGDGTPWKSEHV